MLKVVKYFAIIGAVLVMMIAASVIFLFPRSPELPGPPGPEIEPEHYWRVQANEEQLQRIRELWGKDMTVGEFLEEVYPQALNEMPKDIVRFLFRLKVNWPTPSMDADHPLFGGIAGTITSGNKAPAKEKSFSFTYYLGKQSMEELPRQFQNSSDSQEMYHISIYTGN